MVTIGIMVVVPAAGFTPGVGIGVGMLGGIAGVVVEGVTTVLVITGVALPLRRARRRESNPWRVDVVVLETTTGVETAGVAGAGAGVSAWAGAWA